MHGAVCQVLLRVRDHGKGIGQASRVCAPAVSCGGLLPACGTAASAMMPASMLLRLAPGLPPPICAHATLLSTHPHTHTVQYPTEMSCTAGAAASCTCIARGTTQSKSESLLLACNCSTHHAGPARKHSRSPEDLGLLISSTPGGAAKAWRCAAAARAAGTHRAAAPCARPYHCVHTALPCRLAAGGGRCSPWHPLLPSLDL